MPPGEEDDRPAADLRKAPSRLPKTSRLRIGDILQEMGLATDEQIEEAVARQRETRQRLGPVLVENGVISAHDLMRVLAAKFGVDFIDLTSTQIDPAASGLVSERDCRRYGVSP